MRQNIEISLLLTNTTYSILRNLIDLYICRETDVLRTPLGMVPVSNICNGKNSSKKGLIICLIFLQGLFAHVIPHRRRTLQAEKIETNTVIWNRFFEISAAHGLSPRANDDAAAAAAAAVPRLLNTVVCVYFSPDAKLSKKSVVLEAVTI